MSFTCDITFQVLGINYTLFKWRRILLCRRTNCLSVALLFTCSDVCLSVFPQEVVLHTEQSAGVPEKAKGQ